MAETRRAPGLGMHTGPCLRAGLWLALAGALPLAAAAVGQDTPPDAPKPQSDARVYLEVKEARPQPRVLSGSFPGRPSIAPSSTIPTEALGFAAPGPLYLGERNSLVSLDFIDENRLLFTFRVPALLRRNPGDDGDSDQRQIRAVVLRLPGGTVEKEANWLLHDRARYLWMLHDGHFLLRDRNEIVEGDASLQLKPFLRFPGPLLALQLDPSQEFLVTDSREPAKTAGQAADPPAASTGVDTDQTSGANEPDLVLRILQRESGQAMLVTRTQDLIHLPINDQGYLGSLRGNGMDWMVQMNFFTGGSHPVGTLKSSCMPELNFISAREVVAAACADMGSDALVAMTTHGEKLWIDLVPDRQVWPLLVMAPNGQRMARESLYVTHAISTFAPLGDNDIKGQWLQVIDAANGRVSFEMPVSPIFDAGGNVAFSPSGQRLAVLSGGAIQVFELPAAPTLPDAEQPGQ